MKWQDRRLLDLFGIEHPILQAPMAGASSTQMAIAASQAGGLWLCAGVSLYKYDQGQPLKLIGTLPVPRQIRNRNTTPLTPFEDKRGSVWIGTTTDGLYHYDNPNFVKVGIPQVRVNCFAEDH